MKGIVRNYRKELARRQAKEVSFCELPEIVVEKLIVWDDYESEYTTFDVCGTEIRVLDEELAEALKQLPEQSRNIVLIVFLLGYERFGDRRKAEHQPKHIIQTQKKFT